MGEAREEAIKTKFTTEAEIVKDLSQKIHDAGLDLFEETIVLDEHDDRVAEVIRIAYDMPDRTLLNALIECDVPLYEYDDAVCCISIYQLSDHFDRSGETESTIETAIFEGDTRAIVEDQKIFRKEHHKAWNDYMDRLNDLYNGPHLLKYRLERMGFSSSTFALDNAWNTERRAKAFAALQK